MAFLMWFDGIFDSASDKARLVTVLISAAVAITVVMFNQYLTRRRENIAHRIEKLEELYKATEALSESLQGFILVYDERETAGDDSLDKKGSDSFTKFISSRELVNQSYFTVRMLITLHFPELNFNKVSHSRIETIKNSILRYGTKLNPRLAEDELIQESVKLMRDMDAIAEYCATCMGSPRDARELYLALQQKNMDVFENRKG